MTLICEKDKEGQYVQSSISNLEKGAQVTFFGFVFFFLTDIFFDISAAAF